MAIVVTPLGTNQNKASADPWTAFSSITLAAGDALFLCLSYDYPTAWVTGNVKWNGISYDYVYLSNPVGDVRTGILAWYNPGAGTGDVVIDWDTIPVAMAATLYKATGIATTLAVDKVQRNNGTGTTAATGLTGVLSQADELAICVTAVEDEVDDAHGTWASGAGIVSGNEQFNATNGGGDASNVQCHSVAMVVSSTDSLYGSDGGHDSSDFAAVIATFKAAAGGAEITVTAGLTYVGILRRASSGTKAGSITSGGSLMRSLGLTKAASLTSAGALLASKFLSVALDAALSLGGLTGKALASTLAASISYAGNIGRALSATKAGALDSVGTLGKQSQVFLSGLLDSTASLVRQMNTTLTGVLDATGAALKDVRQTLSSALSFIGTYVGPSVVIPITLTATLAFATLRQKLVSLRIRRYT